MATLEIKAKMGQSYGQLNINQILHKEFPHRSIDAIKGKRKSMAYQEILTSLVSLGMPTVEKYDNRNEEPVVVKKTNLSEAELLKMADLEVQLVRACMAGSGLNSLIHRQFPGRLISAIKSKRTNTEYKVLVGDLMQRVITPTSLETSQEETSSSVCG